MRQLSKQSIVIGVLALVVVAGSVAAWMLYIQPRYNVRLTPAGEITVSRRSVVDERPPTAEERQSYRVSAGAPRYLRIDRLGVNARVLSLGKDADGKIAAPTGIWDVGWYDRSVHPGEPGVAFIDGHISGPTLPAVFKELATLKAGDEVAVERGDGAVLRFAVSDVRRQLVGDIDMDALLKGAAGASPTLVLMTCGGNFDEQSYTYDERVVVISTLI